MRCKGAILVVLLWMLMALSIICISFAKTVRLEGMTSANYQKRVKAYYLASAGISEAIYKIIVYLVESPNRASASPQAELEPVDVEKGSVTLKTDIGEAVVKIEDENGKININTADKRLLIALLAQLGCDETEADEISDCILDWRDSDEDHHANGVESEYYQSLTPPYRSKNADVDTVEELLLVKGVSRDLFAGRVASDAAGGQRFFLGLKQCLTVFGSATGINVNSAPLQVLAAVGFPRETALKILRERQIKPFKDQQDFNARVPEMPGSDVLLAPVITRSPVQSAFFSLVSTATIEHSNVRKTVHAVVKFDQGTPLRHRVYYWNENYFEEEPQLEEVE